MEGKFEKSDIFFVSVVGLFTLCVVLPLLNLIAVSLSGDYAVITGKVTFFPIGINFRAYKVFFMESNVIRSYMNTIIYASLGTLITLILTCLIAYPLSLKKLRYRKFFSLMVLITMFFSGGMIPNFLLVKNLSMIDTIWAIVLPGAISAYFVILMRTFFMGIPASLREAAYIDGANDLFVLIKIIIPLSKPIFSTITLFSIVGYWNSFFAPLLYLNNANLFPIQILLRKIVISSQMMSQDQMKANLNDVLPVAQSIKASAIIVTMIPITIIYPFIQKYFTTGMMIGSIKE